MTISNLERNKGKEHNLVVCEDILINSHINGELSTRPFH